MLADFKIMKSERNSVHLFNQFGDEQLILAFLLHIKPEHSMYLQIAQKVSMHITVLFSLLVNLCNNNTK